MGLLLLFLLFAAFIYAVLFAGRRVASVAWRVLASIALAIAIPLAALTMCAVIERPPW